MSMDFINGLPPGFRFGPTAEDLLHFYLPRRLKGQLFRPFVQDVDIYGNEPWTLFDYNQHSIFYSFCDLKKIGKRVQRRAGSGTWMGQGNIEVNDRYGNIIGVDRFFNFKIKGASHDDHGRWTMHEFAPVDERGYPLDDKVVCVIGHDTQISTKQSVVPKKRKERMTFQTDEETSTKKQCMETSSPSSDLVVSVEAQSATQQIDGLLLSDLFDPMHMLQGTQLGDERQSMETSSPSSALKVSEPQSTEQIDGSLRFDPFDVLQGTHSSSLIPSEAEAQPSLEFDDEGELWVCLDDFYPKS
ncbi:NAC domain-containing protein 72-like [Tripterygium wilfordii]|uniref:NAC domain-containing protein 72-like n=1 Tax=Tripterygium wilfordii TaxID=458696 RepID=UPI0018F82950|nr:NAC domain-containing protein 72-like [Tripterygium wilfordii]